MRSAYPMNQPAPNRRAASTSSSRPACINVSGPGQAEAMEIGIVGILLIILLVVAIIWFARRA
jgi:hypothetical protein